MHKIIVFSVLVLSLLALIPHSSFAQTSDSEGDTVSTCIELTSMLLTFGANDVTTGGQVSLLQDFLIEKHLLVTQTGGPTGYYGAMTVAAVKAYQASKGISQVGSVGPMTRAAIAAETCGTDGGGSTSQGITITTTSLAGGIVGKSYTAPLQATGGTGMSWSISQGALPPGLKLDVVYASCANPPSGTVPVCPSQPMIKGTPTAAGTYTFTVKVVSGTLSATKTFTLVVSGTGSATRHLWGGTAYGNPESTDCVVEGGEGNGGCKVKLSYDVSDFKSDTPLREFKLSASLVRGEGRYSDWSTSIPLSTFSSSYKGTAIPFTFVEGMHDKIEAIRYKLSGRRLKEIVTIKNNLATSSPEAGGSVNISPKLGYQNAPIITQPDAVSNYEAVHFVGTMIKSDAYQLGRIHYDEEQRSCANMRQKAYPIWSGAISAGADETFYVRIPTSQLIASKKYYYCYVATNSGGSVSDYGTVRSFTVDDLRASAPTAGTGGSQTPTVSLSVVGGDMSVSSGATVTFNYDTTGHSGCSLTHMDKDSVSAFRQSISSSAPKGTKTWTASKTSGFLLSCTDSATFSSVSITVDGVQAAFNMSASGISVASGETSSGSGSSIVPEIRYFALQSAGPLTYGQTTKLSWDTNDAQSCRLYTTLVTSSGTNNFGGLGTEVATKEILLVTPLIGTTEYKLTCKIGGESVSEKVSIIVNGSASGTGAGSAIFEATPSTVTSGNPVSLNWDNSTNPLNVSSCSIDTFDGQTTTNESVGPNYGHLTKYPTKTTTYTLKCVTASGSVRRTSATVTVNGSADSNSSAVAPAEPTFYAACSRGSNGAYSLVMAWNSVAGAINYPIRISNNGVNTIIGVPPSNTWNGSTVPAAPTATNYTFYDLPSGTYQYWGHAWNEAGWSSFTQKSVVCSAAFSAAQNTTVALTPTPTVLGASTQCLDLGVNMHRGFESYSVTRLQEFLRSRNLLDEVTGFYGDKTIAAVKEYQASKGLEQSGMTYELTRSAIKAETCGG